MIGKENLFFKILEKYRKRIHKRIKDIDYQYKDKNTHKNINYFILI